MLLADIRPAGIEPADHRQRTCDPLVALSGPGPAWEQLEQLVDRLPNDSGLGHLPAESLAADPRDLASGELDLLSLHTIMMA